MKHRVLKEVKEKHYFWLADGISLKSIQELVDVIPMMDEHVFSHHVNDQRHDFHLQQVCIQKLNFFET